MTPIPRRALPTLLVASALLASCRDLTTSAKSDTVDESELTFVRVDPEAPPLDAYEVSFWAVQGQERQIQISYSSTEYGNGKCLLFRVPADAVMLGVAPGDSVHITIRVTDETQFRFEFEPEGLQFDPAHPAQLEIRYWWADPDYDADGDIDPRDLLLSETFSLWQKVGTGTAWQRVSGAERRRDVFEIASPVLGFTQYALATD
jgi:hypothetical protein